MEKKQFQVEINAPKKKVWKVLWDDATYRKWTSAFAEGSQALSDWKEGSKILFTDGSGRGMVSRIESNKPEEYMAFEHLGEFKDGVEDTTSDAVKKWSGAIESYKLTESNGVTTVTVEMDLADEWAEYFMDTWPKALAGLKELAEK